jgi:4-aminobutyrate aminotransferase-like enzyme
MGPEAAEPVFAEKGEGAWLEDGKGRRYLDFANGGSLPLGYTSGAKTGDSPSERAARGTVPVFAACPALGADGVMWQPEVELMHKLAELVPGGMNRRVLMCDSGREALARAIELARVATGRSRVTYLSDLSDPSDGIFTVSRDVAAVVAHPLDGRIQQARAACDGAGALLLDDETNVGPGASGKMFAVELSGVRPDIHVLGRGWAAGFPFGACVTRSSTLRWERGSSGNPVGCAAALEVIRLLESGLLEQGRRLAANLDKQFEKLNSMRLTPMLWGVGLVRTLVLKAGTGVAAGFVGRCRELGLLLTVLSGDTLAVRPPLVASEKDVDFAAGVVGKVLAEFDKRA